MQRRLKKKEKPVDGVKLGLDREGERGCECAEQFTVEMEI